MLSVCISCFGGEICFVLYTVWLYSFRMPSRPADDLRRTAHEAKKERTCRAPRYIDSEEILGFLQVGISSF